MIAINRFLLVLLCTVVVMICFPDFGSSGWTFAGTLSLVWLGIILVMSVVGSIFGFYRFGGVNRFLTFVLFLGVMYSLLWYLPQDDKVSPINKLKYGQIPTGSDIQRGINKFTFNFAFDKRNARRTENFVNQQDPQELARQEALEQARQQAAQKAKEALKKAAQKLEIEVED